MTFTAATRNPEVLEDLRTLLEACNCQVEGLPFEELESFGASERQSILSPAPSGLINLPVPVSFNKLVIELEHPAEFDGVLERLFGSADKVRSLCEGEMSRPSLRLPCFLIPRGRVKPVDTRASLGQVCPFRYARWRLDDVYGARALTSYDLFGLNDGYLIDLLQTGSILRQIENDAIRVVGSTDCEYLAKVAERASFAARFDANTWKDLCVGVIDRLYELRDDFLTRAVILGVLPASVHNLCWRGGRRCRGRRRGISGRRRGAW